MMVLVLSGAAGLGQQPQPQQSIPDAPAPQPAGSTGLGDLKQEVTPGVGAVPAPPKRTFAPGENQAADSPDASQSSSSQTNSQAPPASTPNQPEAPEIPLAGQGPQATLVVPVNEVIVPVTIRDKKGALVPAIDWRRFRVYEDGVRRNIVFFTTDPFPLSVAFVVDQSLPADIMNKVNESLAAVTGAFSPADSVAVFAYNNSPREITDFTGAQGPRLSAALLQAKAPGRDMGVDAPGGPLDGGISINGQGIDPNLENQHGNNMGFSIHPREYHPLNDAILEAAEALAKQPRDRRRVIYIISDGKEQGSKASYKEVVRFLLSNNITLSGTLVGDSAVWGLGYLDKKHIPFLPTMRDNLLPKYQLATGGTLDAEVSENGIQASFAKITDSTRQQYTLGYTSPAGQMASRFHTIEVRVEGIPNLDIVTRDGYYPSANQMTH
jgi:VWFA-related protein